MRLLAFLSTLFFLSTSMCIAHEQTDDMIEDEFREWVTYYYIDKDPAPTGDYIKWLQDKQILENEDNANLTTSTFLSFVFAQHPDLIGNWLRASTLTGETKAAVERALWLSDNSKMLHLLFKNGANYVNNKKPTPLSNIAPDNAMHIDMLWAGFMATGNSLYVERIIGALSQSKNPTKEELNAQHSAFTSLKANAIAHKLVFDTIVEQSKKQKEGIQKQLEEIIQTIYNDKKSFPNKDGDFSADLAIIKSKNLEELDKPGTRGPIVHQIKEVNAGEDVAVMVYFTGVSLSKDYSANVTYNLQVFAPNNQINKTINLKNLVGTKQKLASGILVFKANSFVSNTYEPTDTRGTYIFKVTIYDHIGNKKVKVVKTLDLID